VAKVATSNPDRTISLQWLQCVVENKLHVLRRKCSKCPIGFPEHTRFAAYMHYFTISSLSTLRDLILFNSVSRYTIKYIGLQLYYFPVMRLVSIAHHGKQVYHGHVHCALRIQQKC
jgi:hypothetical protein